MADVRYQIPGVPPEAAKGISAFAPAFVRHAGSGAQQYKPAVRGFPGTRGIGVPARRDAQISPDYGDLASAGSSRSSDAPDAIYPNQYYQAFVTERPGGNAPDVRFYAPQYPGRTTLLPVPAEDGRAAYQALSARLAQPAITNRKGAMPGLPRIFQIQEGTWYGRYQGE